ncbi:MAG: glycosyltransferase family 9 protein [Candidatus Xenobiia bacterium LiM19]
MYLLMAPRGTTEKGMFYGHQIVDGKIMVFTQYWWHLFRYMGWRDITPPGWGGSSIRPAGLNKVLHVHHSAIGDMLFTTPVFKAFAERYPGITQTVITSKKGATVLEGNPWIREIRIDRENPTDDVIAQFDDVISYDGMLTLFPESELMNVYDVAAEWAGIELADHRKKPEMYFLDHEQGIADALLASWGFSPGDRYVMIQYDASQNVRAIPHITVLDLAERIAGDGYKVVLFGQGDLGKKVQWKCKVCGKRNLARMGSRTNEIKAVCPCGASGRVQRGDDPTSGLYFIDSGTVTIRTIALLIKEAVAFIGPDSCGIHLAACFERPSLGIFFSFDGDLRMRYYRNARCMQIDVPCGPCFQHGMRRCWYPRRRRIFAMRGNADLRFHLSGIFLHDERRAHTQCCPLYSPSGPGLPILHLGVTLLCLQEENSMLL